MPIRFLMLLLCAALVQPVPSAAGALHTGVQLRMHVIAQDDTPAMQAVKAPVRDAVQAAYQRSPLRTGSMLADALLIRPALTNAACSAACAAGFTGPVSVSVELADFDDRTLQGVPVPAGRYPALMIRLGDARGRNWWGLLDPDAALAGAAVDHDGETVVWDWSLHAFWEALIGWIGGTDNAK